MKSLPTLFSDLLLRSQAIAKCGENSATYSGQLMSGHQGKDTMMPSTWKR